MDETTAPVLDPGRGVTKTGYLWALARDDRAWGGESPPGVAYFYAPGRAGENAETFLTGFDGILQVDGYTGYNRLTKPSRKGGAPIRVAHCWAHARRKLKEVFDRDGSEIAAEGLRRIAEFYASRPTFVASPPVSGCLPAKLEPRRWWPSLAIGCRCNAERSPLNPAWAKS